VRAISSHHNDIDRHERELAARRRFEEHVADALDSLPPEFAARMSNVAVVVEDGEPSSHLLGLYQGIDQTRRDRWYAGVLPDVITIYRKPIEARCRDDAELAVAVRVTVIHEIAHHFGISDERLHELGWG
jgi:predicted Zn-dependent protease with MMP-like domain